MKSTKIKTSVDEPPVGGSHERVVRPTEAELNYTDEEPKDMRAEGDWYRVNGWGGMRECPACGGNGKYDDCTPCPDCDGEGGIEC